MADPTPARTGLPQRATCRRHTRRESGCGDCRAADNAYNKRRKKLIAYGRWTGRVDAASAVEHLAELRRAGMTLRHIAAAAQLSKSIIEDLHTGKRTAAYQRTIDAICAVTPGADLAARVSSADASRRLQALAAIGWSGSDLAGRLGTSALQVRAWRFRRREAMPAAAHHAVADVYDELCGTPGPSQAARRSAVAAGYLPPEHPDNADLRRHAPTPTAVVVPVPVRLAGSGLLCDGQDPNMWTVGDPRNAQAMALCSACPGCPASDDTPRGVIRDGIPYSGKGRPLPACPDCGLPNQDYRGGNVGPCAGCVPGQVDVASQREAVERLFGQGLTPAEIAREIGAPRPAVRKAIERWQLRRGARVAA